MDLKAYPNFWNEIVSLYLYHDLTQMKTHFHIRCADNQQANSSRILRVLKLAQAEHFVDLAQSFSEAILDSSSGCPRCGTRVGTGDLVPFGLAFRSEKLWLPGTVPSTLLQHRGRRCHVSKELKRYGKDKILEKLEEFFPFVQKIHCLNGSQITMSFMSNIHAGPKTALTLLLMRSYLLDTEIRIWPGECET